MTGYPGIKSLIRKSDNVSGGSDSFPYRAKLLHLWELINIGITSDR